MRHRGPGHRTAGTEMRKETTLVLAGAKNILVPVDFSRYSNKAYLYALDMARCSEGRICLLHVLDTELVRGVAHVETEERFLARMRSRAEKRLHALYHKHEDEGVQVDIIFREGKPHKEILKTAKEEGVDIIIMGSRGRTGMERALFGSVAEKVARLCTVPVLLIK